MSYSFNLNDAVVFESAVWHLLDRAIAVSEQVEMLHHGPFDFFLPKGLKLMGWPSDTYVELKYKLVYNTLDRLVVRKENVKCSKLVVIVKDIEEGVQPAQFVIYREKYNIDVIDYNTIRKKLSRLKRKPKEKDSKKSRKNGTINEISDDVLIRAKERMKNDTVTFFLGAGVSASAGVVTWESLLEQLCIKKKLSKIDSDIDSTIKGRFIVDNYKIDGEITSKFYEDMKSILYPKDIEPSELIKSIANLVKEENVESVISYNYDDLLEEYINNSAHRNCMPVYEGVRLEKKDDLPVYHVHGLIPKIGNSSSIVLGEREYHKLYQEAYNWGNVEQLHALTRNTCFFIGLSMKDPNLRRLLDFSVQKGSEKNRIHFAFLRRIEYDVVFTEANMREFGVNCIWYDNHADLPKLLDDLIK